MIRQLTPFAIWLGLIANPIAALAEPALVQSGEHAAFSRLVTPRAGSEWSVTQTGRTVALTLDGFDQGFDISSVFDLIPRTRVSNVSASANQLTLTLACDCAVSAFLERNAFVVIDVAATSDVLENPPIKIAQTPQPIPKTRQMDVSDTAVTRAKLPQTLPTSAVPLPDLAAQGALSPQAAGVLADVQTRLNEELTTAAERGLLQAAPNLVPRMNARPQIDTRVFTEPTADGPVVVRPSNEVSPGTNLRITTSRDLPDTFRDLAEIVNNSGQSCPSDDTLTISEWGNNNSFALQMATARQGLYGEFDRIDPDVALRLARTYLYFGFGAEARDILKLEADLAASSAHLLVMANILDGDAPQSGNALSELIGCEGETALWVVLALPDPPQGVLPPSTPALLAVNNLPPHLRTILAPRLSAVLRSYGDPDGAEVALRNLDRLPDPFPPSVTMAQAAIDIDNGDTRAGAAKLTEVAQSNAPQSPEALIALVDAQVASGKAIPPDVASLIEAYARELKNTELAGPLQRVQILALADSGQFTAAFGLPSPSAKVSAHVVSKLTEIADDITFLEYSFIQPGAVFDTLPADALIALATRQLDLGFAARAELTLGHVPPRPLREERQVIAARIALAMGKPQKAIAELLDVTSAKADSLRADAKRMSGAHDDAHRIYAQNNQPKAAAETAWLSENWRSLTPSDTPLFGQVAQLETPDVITPGPTEGMLSRSAAILEQTTQARETLQSLLQADGLQLARQDGS